MKNDPAQNIKTEFSQRLKTALNNCDISPSPTALRNAFNERYDGNPISIQTASNWLSGVAIPSQDKLQVLANWLSVDSQWLRFGDNAMPVMLGAIGDQALLIKGFALLSPTHQKIVMDLVTSLLPKNKP